MMSKHVMN